MVYTKIENGRQIYCPDFGTIRLAQGGWISRPSPEQFAAEGWVEFVPPVIEPTPQTEPDTEDILNAVKRMLSSETKELSDEDALDVASLFPTWSSMLGESVTAGTRVWDDGRLWKVLQPHTFQANWRPADSPSLFVEVSIEEGPEFVQPTGYQDAYMTGDKVTYNGVHYTSLIDGNIGDPITYPAGGQQE